jgi:tripartite-type tricarboxylate transporter receptor subunit TctC
MGLVVFLWGSMPLCAQSWPNRPVRIVAPFTPGGPVDLVGRISAQRLSILLGQPFLVDNRGGAGGIIGTEIVAKAPPDGYTLLFTTGSHASNPAYVKKLPYDTIKDFSPVTMIGKNYGQVYVIHPSIPVRSVRQFIGFSKSHPGQMTYGANGTGNITYIAAELLKSMAGIQLLEIQYKGTGPVVTDLLGGHLDTAFVAPQSTMPLIQSGKLRAIGMTGLKRWSVMPEVPTFDESGLKGYNLIGWFAFWFPGAVPVDIVNRLQGEIAKMVHEPEMKKRFEDIGLIVDGSKSSDFAQFVADDMAFNLTLAKKIGVQPQ